MPSSLDDWLSRLELAHPSTIELGLERVASVRDAMALRPEFPIVIVGGTNGKGSICAYLEAILRAQGYKTGLYTSPHLLRYNERVRIDGLEAGDRDIVAGMEAVEAARGDVSLTYFEHGTLAAVWQFVREEVDVAILEVGLGGRLDAVNIFDPVLTIVASIDLDHQAWLGNSREQIGFEKAGIFRTGVPAICGDADPPKSLVDQARAIGARFLGLGTGFSYERSRLGWSLELGETILNDLPLPTMVGAHQLENAATALAGLSVLAEALPVTLEAIHAGLRNASLAGRFQRICGQVEVVLDVAHNPESARALAENLNEQPVRGKTFAVFALLADKDASGVVDALRDSFDAWFVAGLEGERGQPGELLAAVVRPRVSVPVEVFDDPLSAFAAASLRAVDGDRIIVFGSFFTVAAVLGSR